MVSFTLFGFHENRYQSNSLLKRRPTSRPGNYNTRLCKIHDLELKDKPTDIKIASFTLFCFNENRYQDNSLLRRRPTFRPDSNLVCKIHLKLKDKVTVISKVSFALFGFHGNRLP